MFLQNHANIEEEGAEFESHGDKIPTQRSHMFFAYRYLEGAR